MDCVRRLGVGVTGFALAVLAFAGTAQAEIPASLKSDASCSVKTPAPGYSYRFCDDGIPPFAGRTPNPGASQAVSVPAKYEGYRGLPEKAGDAASEPGADAQGDVALDVDVSIPTIPAPKRGYPLLVMMHGLGGNKTSFEGTSFDDPGEKWHYTNAWFASRGYVVVTYTARGHRTGSSGSTGETQLDSRRYEINDFQSIAGQIADDPYFNVNPKRVVTTGGSYGGGFSWLALTDPIWESPDGRDVKLAAVAPKYGWTDVVYSLIPNGNHFQSPHRLPDPDASDTTEPLGPPKESILRALFLVGQLNATWPPSIVEANTCLTSSDPFETNPLCTRTIAETLPEFISDRSAYYQNRFFKKIRDSRKYRIPVYSAGTLTDPLFPAIEHLRMSNRLRKASRHYPIQEYYGDYQHFTQNKAKEWGDLCGADHHVCALADYPGGNVNSTPTGRVAVGVTTRLNRFIDHYAEPPGNADEPKPAFDVTASLQICPQNAGTTPLDEPGERFTARTFRGLAPNTLKIELSGSRATSNVADPHATAADPLANAFINGGRCPSHTTPAGPGVAVYDSDPLPSTATMIGGTIISIDYTASTTEGNFQLDTRLYDVFPNGTAVLVDRGPKRVTDPSGSVTYQLHGNGWRFETGHRIRVEITQNDAPFLKASVIASTAELTGVRLRVPVRESQPGGRDDNDGDGDSHPRRKRIR